jgi:gluconolactonase
VGGAPNGLLVRSDGLLVFCDAKANAIRTLDPKTGQTTTLVNQINGKPLSAPNDLIEDKHGNILFTCPGGSQHHPIGYMCALTPAGDLHIIAEGMYFPNGLLLIDDERSIIINETWQHRLLIGDWDVANFKINNIRSFYHIGGTAEPDGLTLSKDGHIYAAVYGTQKVWVFDRNAHLINQIDLPGKNPTNLCFDTFGDLGLLVTETEKGVLLSIK